MKWLVPICVIAAFLIAISVAAGFWYSDEKDERSQSVTVPETIPEPVPQSQLLPVVKEEPVTLSLTPGILSLTPEEIRELPYDERPLEATWYKVYASILEDPTGYRRGVDYTPVVPYIHRAMEKGYLINADYQIIRIEIEKAQAIPEKERIDKAMREAQEKMGKALSK